MKKNDETYIQIYVVSFFKKLQLISPNFIFFHVPNGGKRTKSEAATLKLAGVIPGIPDLCLIGHGQTRFIEMKTTVGALSIHQKDIIEKLNNFGVTTDVVFCSTPHEAMEKMAPIMLAFNYDQNAISQASSSVLDSL